MKHWFKNILEGTTYQGLEVFEMENATFFSLLKVKRIKGELHMVSEALFENVEELVATINKKQPLFLTVNTSKVLRKQIPTDLKGSLEQWVSFAFPNLDLENFFYEVMDSKELRVVSIGKKEHIDPFLETLESQGINPTSISLGVTDVGTCLTHFTGTVIQGSNFELSKNDGAGYILMPKNKLLSGTVELNGLTLSNTGLLPFSNILGHLGKPQRESNLVQINERFGNDFRNDRVFDLGIRWGLSIFLVILLSNFFLFSYYHDKTIDMETSSSIEQQNTILKALKIKVTEKEDRLKTLMGSASSKSSFYMDRIATEIPESIQLENMVYQPLSKPVRDENPIEVLEQSILLAGNTNDKGEFSQWTELMENKSWVSKVEISGYEYVSRSMDKFSIKITTNEVEQ